MKRNKGITLIALVITIIVLLILAGVAISMLSGENGILKKAADAKTKTEEGQKQEETALTTMELETHFQIKNSQYKCRYGFITGITVGDKVSKLQSALPDGYIIKKKCSYDNNTEEWKEENIEDKDNTNVSTGMTVEKDGKTVARTVVFGNINGDEFINMSDAGMISNYINDYIQLKNEFCLVAMDVNNDGKINSEDANFITEVYHGNKSIEQNRYADNPKEILSESNSYLKQKYIEETKKKLENTSYTGELKKSGNYNIKGITEGTTVQNILDILPENTEIQRSRQVLNNTDIVQRSDRIIYSYDGRKIDIGIIVM